MSSIADNIALAALVIVLLCAIVQWLADRSATHRERPPAAPKGPRRTATSYERAAEAQWRAARGAQ